ncbi:MAG TPA: helicase-related protein [Sedimentisphaerales bacterium]|nr:helicase-related protein [Sedimentisphaerales bacterium]
MDRRIELDCNSVDDYKLFLQIKALPAYRFVGRTAYVAERYARKLGLSPKKRKRLPVKPSHFLFDYQRDIARMAIEKQKFAIFADCGLGKTLMFMEYAAHVNKVLPSGQAILLVSPLMVVEQTVEECRRFYGNAMEWEYISAKRLPEWLGSGGRFGITNYEAMRDDVPQGRLGALIVDESSMLKSHYGKWGGTILRLGRGLDWKLCGTGTPAPNDRIEYANHAVFMDAFPNVNSFLARFFVNRGQTQGRWELKAHAVRPFYQALSDWAIFLTNPATYGWRDHSGDIPPIHVHIHDVPLTTAQTVALQNHTGDLFTTSLGGISSRSKIAQISKGTVNGEKVDTNKPAYIRGLVESWPEESTIIWCHYNAEQAIMANTFPEAASISGDTPHDKRMEMVADFKAGRIQILISKPKILGFGLNLQIATRQLFSGLQDSYEQFYQAVKRSNRVGSTRPLNVHIPVTEAEWPMVQNVLRKADRVQADGEHQEALFHEHSFRT